VTPVNLRTSTPSIDLLAQASSTKNPASRTVS
jgi:hypothetical protein